MKLLRHMEEEWLDELPADDPRALRSRRDLRRVNAVMLQARIMARSFARHYSRDEPRTVLELGAGDGSFMLRLARRLAPRWRNVTVIMVDRQNIVERKTRAAFDALGWQVATVTADVKDFFRQQVPCPVDIVCANLFLHHFADEQLALLLGQAASLAPFFVACEPRRSALALFASRLLWAIGCNDVSRHDAVASVKAGFYGREISALWPAHGDWQLHEHAAGLFSHCFVARRPA